MIFTKKHPNGFTLVELIVAIAIIGILMALLLPAVQMAREAARRSTCQSRLKNLALGVLSFESSELAFPYGGVFQTQHSWGQQILPFVEQRPVYDRIDVNANWNQLGINSETAELDLQLFHCPSSEKDFDGKTDYCGISGSWNTTLPMNALEPNGVLYPVYRNNAPKIRTRSVTDGLSTTVMIAEGAEVLEINDGYWMCGLNCFTHEEGGVNNPDRPADEIISDHGGGAQVVMCDGSVHFLSDHIDHVIVSAMCTRNGREPAYDFR